MRRAFPGSEYYGGSALPGPSAVGAPIPASGPDARCREPRPGSSRVHCDSLDEVGARLCPCGIASGTPQAFPAASRPAPKHQPGSSPPVMKGRCAPRPARIRQVRAGRSLRDVNAGSSRTPFRHARRARDIWRSWPVPALPGPLATLPRRHPGRAAPSFTGLLRQPGGEGLSPPLESTAPSRRTRALIEAIQHQPAGTPIRDIKDRIIARRGKEARNIAKVAAARQLLTCVYYAMRDGHVRSLAARTARQAA